MKYWSSAPWKVVVLKSNGDESTNLLSLPVALIGSDPACNIRLDEVRAQPLAYIAVAFDDSVEVWPLCALAYPRWGIVGPKSKVRVGHAKVNLALTSDPGNPKQPRKHVSKDSGIDQDPGDRPLHVLQLDFRGDSYPFAMGRRIVILGDGHPSTFRIHGAGLAQCDHAIVNLDQCCWLVNLQPDPTQLIDDRVKILQVGDTPIQIGELQISYRLSTPDEFLNHRPTNEAATLIRTPKADEERRQRHQGERSRELFETANEDQKTMPVVVRHPALDVESVTSDVTNRLASIHQSRWWQSRMVKAGLFGLLFLSAIGAFAWIVIQHVLPVLLDLEGG
jgi:hypothetical protein